ncbi:MAG: hypothetical protein ACJA0P_002618 [Planctomycetota bacterium]|jgi:hypothetical protein
MIIASLGAGLVSLQSAMTKRQDFSIDRRRALYLAEAGVAEAALAVTLGKTGVIASEEVPASFGGGVYWVEADELPDDRVLLRCTARIASAEFVVQSMVKPNVNPVTRLGLFGTDGVTLGWGTVIDGYHSGQGDYASQVDGALATLSTGVLGLVGSDAHIVLSDFEDVITTEELADESPPVNWRELVTSEPLAGEAPPPSAPAELPPATFIFGELRPGKNGVVQSSGLAILVGDVRPFDAPPILPEVSLPAPEEVILTGIKVTASQTGIGMTIATDLQGPLEVLDGATLTIEGPKVLRCNSLTVGRGATLVLNDEDGPIHIYAENGICLREGSVLLSTAPEAAARGTYLFVPGAAEQRDRVVLDATGFFHGALYAPDDMATLKPGLRWNGSLVARVVRTEPGCRFTFDRRLGIGGDGFPALPRQLSWQVVPLGKQIARTLMIDPLVKLALQGVNPIPSSEAFIETDLEIQYMDQSHQEATFDGSFAAFDPTVAKRIIAARWEDPRDGTMRQWTTPAGSESTDAVEDMRASLRLLRKVILEQLPGTDVTALTDEEALVEAAVQISLADLALAPVSMQRAVQRVDTTEPTLDPDPVTRALRAAQEARDYAAKATEFENQASILVVAPLSPLAQGTYDALRAATANAIAAADASGLSARTASATTGTAQTDAADEAERLAAEALSFALEASTLFSTLTGQM